MFYIYIYIRWKPRLNHQQEQQSCHLDIAYQSELEDCTWQSSYASSAYGTVKQVPDCTEYIIYASPTQQTAA